MSQPPGHEREDERQEALIGLFEACRQFDPARGRFGALATLRVRSRVWNARERVRAGKHMILTEAMRFEHVEPGEEDEDETVLTKTLSAGEGADPAVVVELRDELRTRALDPAQPRRRQRRARRCFTDEEIATALSLIAEGKSLREAGDAVGAWPSSVANWVRKAA